MPDKLETLDDSSLLDLEAKIRLATLGSDKESRRQFGNFHSQVLGEITRRRDRMPV